MDSGICLSRESDHWAFEILGSCCQLKQYISDVIYYVCLTAATYCLRIAFQRCNCSSTTFLGSCGYNLPSNSKTSWLSASSVVSADRELLIVMDIHYKHSPMLKSLHKSTILFGPFLCSFLEVKKFNPSVSYLVMNQHRDMSISIIFIPCICLLSVHIGICSKRNKYCACPMVYELEEVHDLHWDCFW